MSDEKWTSNPGLNNIDPAKLQTLLSMANQAKEKKQSDLLPFLMSLSSQKGGTINFSSDESEAIISALKAGKSPKEIRKIDKMMGMLRTMKR